MRIRDENNSSNKRSSDDKMIEATYSSLLTIRTT